MKRTIATISSALVLCSAAFSQSINIDLGFTVDGSPSPSYGGAAASPGVWNNIQTFFVTSPHALVDLSGAPTGVTLTTPLNVSIAFQNPCLLGEDELLLGDLCSPVPGGTFVFDGLANGSYSVISYGFAPDDYTWTTAIDVVGGTGGVQVVGGYDWCTTGMHGKLDTYALHTVDVTAGTITITYDMGTSTYSSLNGFQLVAGDASLGMNYCTAASNSTGSPATMGATGSDVVGDQDLMLHASGLPAGQFGIFVASMTQAFLPGANGTSNGNLCVGGAIGRFVGPGQVLSSGASGEFSLAVDLMQIPQGNGFVPVMPGETWNFQAWHRDGTGLGSNFTDGLEVPFR